MEKGRAGMRKTNRNWLYLPLVGAALSISLAAKASQIPLWTLGAGSALAGPVPAMRAAMSQQAAAQAKESPNPPAQVPDQIPEPTPEQVAPTELPANIAPQINDWVDLPEGDPPAGAGKVTEKHYSQAAGGVFVPCGPATIRNNTKSTSQQDIAVAVQAGLPFSIEKNSAEPQVLILHTHATECYRTHNGLWYAPGDTARSTDNSISVCAVGQVMTDVLTAAGVNTIHDTTLNDYPSYNASYDNSRAVAQSWLEKYPSIKVILDVHRDAIESDGVRIAPVSEIDGRKSAQVMIISGADNGGTVKLPNCMQNLAFAAAWQSAMETDYPSLTRPVLYSHRFYNQDLSTGALLLEVGGHGTNLNEALYAGRLAAQSLARVLLQD